MRSTALPLIEFRLSRISSHLWPRPTGGNEHQREPNPPIGNLPPVDPQHRVVVRDESVEFYPHEPSQADARYAQERSQPTFVPREQSFTTQPAQAVPPDIFPRIRMLANELRRESPERAAAFLSAIEKSEPSGWPTIVSAWSATHLIRRDLRLSQSADAPKTKNSALGAVADRAPELPPARRRAEPQPSAAHDFMNFKRGRRCVGPKGKCPLF